MATLPTPAVRTEFKSRAFSDDELARLLRLVFGIEPTPAPAGGDAKASR